MHAKWRQTKLITNVYSRKHLKALLLQKTSSFCHKRFLSFFLTVYTENLVWLNTGSGHNTSVFSGNHQPLNGHKLLWCYQEQLSYTDPLTFSDTCKMMSSLSFFSCCSSGGGPEGEDRAGQRKRCISCCGTKTHLCRWVRGWHWQTKHMELSYSLFSEPSVC